MSGRISIAGDEVSSTIKTLEEASSSAGVDSVRREEATPPTTDATAALNQTFTLIWGAAQAVLEDVRDSSSRLRAAVEATRADLLATDEEAGLILDQLLSRLSD